MTLDKDRAAATKLDGKLQDAFSWLRWLSSPSIDWQKNLTQTLTDHAMKTYIELIKEELGPDTVRRLEEGRILAQLPLSRIKPRRALAA